MHSLLHDTLHRRTHRWIWALLPIVVIVSALALWPLSQAAAQTTVVVRASAPNGWTLTPEIPPQNTGSGSFVAGPATPPLGTGSAQFTVDSTGSYLLVNTSYNGTRLADLTSLSYSTYRLAGNAALAPALQFNIDYNLNDANGAWQGRLNYEPYLAGTVQDTTWQTWDALAGPASGTWWSSGAPGNGVCPQANPCTLTEVLTAFPTIGVQNNALGAILFKSGSNWAGGFTGNVDNFTIGTAASQTTFDFEPEIACTTTCYVDAVNGNDSFGGDTAASAKKTIQAAVTQALAGGTIIIAAGSYPEQVTIAKDGLTLQGAGIGQTVVQGASCTGNGITLSGTRNGLTVKAMTLTGFLNGIYLGEIGDTQNNILIEDLSSSANCQHGILGQAGFYNTVTLNRVAASNNGDAAHTAGRGIWFINGVKTDIAITNSTFNMNKLVGIDFGDGNVTGLTVTGNTVQNNGDSGIGVLGAKGPNANLIDANSVGNNGRFGIEIKVSTGNGSDSGAGSVVVSNNTVTRTLAATDLRDYAGIAVIRRSGNPTNNADQPSGTVLLITTVSGFRRATSGSTGDGFGIVVEGANQIVKGNSASNNDVGIQAQGGNTANTQSTVFFDRGDASAGSPVIGPNTITNNDIGVRVAGTSATIGDGTSISGGTTGLVINGAVAPVTLGSVAFSGQSADYITLVNYVTDLTGQTSTFGGVVGSALDAAQYAAVQAKITDKNDIAALGLAILADPQLIVDPTTLSFTTVAGAPVPAAQSFTISNLRVAGGAFDWTVSAPAYTPTGSDWLTCTPPSGTGLAIGSSATVSCQPQSVSLTPGTYTAVSTVASSTAGVVGSPQHVTTTLTVAPLGVTITPNSLTVQTGGNGTLTVAIDAIQQNDTVVSLASSASTTASVPATATIPAGQLSIAVPVAGVAAGGPATITATLPAALGGDTNTTNVTVAAVGITIAAPASTIRVGRASVVTITISPAQPTATTLTLSSSLPGVVAIQGTVTVPASATSVTVPITGTTSGGPATITAALPSALGGGTASIDITVATISLTLTPATSTVVVGSQRVLTVSINAVQSGNTTVTLVSSAPGVASVPSTIVIPAGQTSVTSPITAVSVGGPVTITAALPATVGGSTATAQITVTAVPNTLYRLLLPVVRHV